MRRLAEEQDEIRGALGHLQDTGQHAAANLATALAEQAAVLELADLAGSLAAKAGDRGMEAAALSCPGDALIWIRPEQGRRTLERAIAVAASSSEPTPRWGWARRIRGTGRRHE